MNKIKFGDQKSIDYAKAKGRIDLKVYRIHECDCEDCHRPTFECPYCESEREPVSLNQFVLKCVDCEKMAYNNDFQR